MSEALSFEHVCVRFNGRLALNDVTAAAEAGKLTGIVGPNGAGKTTLLRAALGLLPAAGGMIRIQNKPLSAWRLVALARASAYLPQGGEAKWPMQAAEVAMLGRLPYLSRFALPSAVDVAAVEDAMVRCDVMRFAGRAMDGLSAGERARVLLARALATQAPLLLADEPAAFLDPAHQFGLMELLQVEAARGAAVVVTLHDLALAARYCDRLIVLCGGAVAAAGPPSLALTDGILARVFAVAPLRAPDLDGKVPVAFRKI